MAGLATPLMFYALYISDSPKMESKKTSTGSPQAESKHTLKKMMASSPKTESKRALKMTEGSPKTESKQGVKTTTGSPKSDSKGVVKPTARRLPASPPLPFKHVCWCGMPPYSPPLCT